MSKRGGNPLFFINFFVHKLFTNKGRNVHNCAGRCHIGGPDFVNVL